MLKFIIYLRNLIFEFFYRQIFKRFFFIFDPEFIHDRFIFIGKFLGSNFLTRFFLRFFFSFPEQNNLKQNILGIDFKNPIGLSAGFDKNAQILNTISCVGFGFSEVGSVTANSSTGNDGKRLWRLKKSKSLQVYYGLKNDGADFISKKLKNKIYNIPFGISIAKTNSKACIGLELEVNDYLYSYKKFKNIGDYFTINISCPNTYGGEPFLDSKKLKKLLDVLKKEKKVKPVFLKLSPDLSNKELDSIIDVSRDSKMIDGFISSNLTKNFDKIKLKKGEIIHKGGLSGNLVNSLALKQVSYLYKKTKGEFLIIGCGGVFSSDDAYEMIKSGASLVQLITGMIFIGPQQISQINLELSRMLKKDGFDNISEAIGINNQK